MNSSVQEFAVFGKDSLFQPTNAKTLLVDRLDIGTLAVAILPPQDVEAAIENLKKMVVKKKVQITSNNVSGLFVQGDFISPAKNCYSEIVLLELRVPTTQHLDAKFSRSIRFLDKLKKLGIESIDTSYYTEYKDKAFQLKLQDFCHVEKIYSADMLAAFQVVELSRLKLIWNPIIRNSGDYFFMKLKVTQHWKAGKQTKAQIPGHTEWIQKLLTLV